MNNPAPFQAESLPDQRGRLVKRMQIPRFSEGWDEPHITSVRAMNRLVVGCNALLSAKIIRGGSDDIIVTDSNYVIQLGETDSKLPATFVGDTFCVAGAVSYQLDSTFVAGWNATPFVCNPTTWNGTLFQSQTYTSIMDPAGGSNNRCSLVCTHVSGNFWNIIVTLSTNVFWRGAGPSNTTGPTGTYTANINMFPGTVPNTCTLT